MILTTLSVRSAVLLTALAALPAPTLAQGTADQRSACIGDAFSFCGADIPVVTKIEACLIKKMSELSPGCRDEFHKPPEGRTNLKPEHFKS